MIKKLLLFIMLCVSTVVAWAQTGTYGTDPNTATISASGSTLTITGKGDLTTINQDVVTYKFKANAVGAVYRSTDGGSTATSVAENDIFSNSANTYYKEILGEKTRVDIDGEGLDVAIYTLDTYVTGSSVRNVSSYIESKLQEQDLYYCYGTNNSWTIGGRTGSFTNGDPTKVSSTSDVATFSSVIYMVEDAENGTIRQYVTGNESDDKFFRPITEEEFNAYIQSTTYFKLNQPLYTSTNGTDFTRQEANIEIAYNPAVHFYSVGASTFEPYDNHLGSKESVFALFNSNDYLSSESTPMSFVEILTNAILGGSYTDVVFANEGAGALTINPAIVQAILFPNGVQNNSITNLDLGAATITSFTGAFEQPGASVGSFHGKLHELTLPLSADGIVPANAIPDGYNDTKGDLKIVHVPTGYTKVGANAFYNRNLLTTVTLPSGITEIGANAFENCTFTSIVLPETLVTIDNYAFANTKLSSTKENPFVFPASLKNINAGAFIGCLQFQTLNFNEGLEFIGNSAFLAESAIKKQEPTLDFPSTLKYIGPGAFFNRNYADIYFHSEIAPCCPVGPSIVSTKNFDMCAFGAETHMGNDGFIQNGLERGGDNATDGWANRENYYKSDTGYFTILHFPAGISAENAKTFKDITRQYKFALGYTGVYEDNDFHYGGSVECGEEPEGSKVREFKDYNGSTTWESRGAFHRVQPGYRDTYLGEQKIWPSQSQWMRAYTTVANGVEYNGRTPYRPTVTTEMIELMKRDNLRIYDKETSSYLPISGTDYVLNEAMANSYNSTLEGAVRAGDVIDYLDTQDDVNTYNAELPGALVAGTHNYTAEQAKAHNAALPTAISTATIKEPAVEGHGDIYYAWTELAYINDVSYDINTVDCHEGRIVSDDEWVQASNWQKYLKSTCIYHETSYYTDEEYEALSEQDKYNVQKDDETGKYIKEAAYYEAGASSINVLQDSEGQWYYKTYYTTRADSKLADTQTIKEPAVVGHDDIYYTQTEVDEYNADPARNPGAVSTSNTYTITEQEAIAANAKLPGAKKLNDPWHYYDEDTAIAHNAELTGAMKNDGEGNYGTLDVAEAFADYISKIAYQSTRRFVLADDGSYKDNYFKPEGISGHNWWTIVFPFNMTKKQVRDVFGDGVHDPHVCLFSGVDRDEKGTDGTKHIVLKFQNDVYAHNTPISAYKTDGSGAHYAEFDETADAPDDNDIVIKAFEAYMIYPTKDSQDAANFYIPNPRVEQGSPYPTVIKANTEIENRNEAKYKESTDHTEYRYVGSVLKQLVNPDGSFRQNTIPQYSYVYAKKKNDTKYQFWFYTGTTSIWKPNKCLVQATEKDGGASDNENFFGSTSKTKQTSLFGFNFEDDEEENIATGVENVTIVVGEGDDAAIYNISGQRISHAQKGIYIKNGKKYIAR